MACRIMQLPEGRSAIICGGRGSLPKCSYCSRRGTQLCDFPTGNEEPGMDGTCSKPVCEKCTRKGATLGEDGKPKYDFCKEHFEIAKEMYERRMRMAANKVLYGK